MHQKRAFSPLEIKISHRANNKFLTGFTLIELLVVVSIIALLMAIIMPALTRARDQTKDAICMANLHHWGSVFQMYTGDNDGYFQDRVWFDESGEPWNNPLCFGGHSWPTTLLPYYADPKLRFCPKAVKSFSQGAPLRHAAWIQMDNVLGPDEIEYSPAGSYGMNGWIVKNDLEYTSEEYWRTPNIRNAAEVPVLLDAWWPSGFPYDEEEPPPFDGAIYWGEITRYCLDRHNLAVYALFCDWSVRKVGLRQLWQLRWHRLWDFDNCPDPDDLQDWPEWMRRSQTYD